jgi:hypothetical protein
VFALSKGFLIMSKTGSLKARGLINVDWGSPSVSVLSTKSTTRSFYVGVASNIAFKIISGELHKLSLYNPSNTHPALQSLD